jgi:hypothetical protein
MEEKQDSNWKCGTAMVMAGASEKEDYMVLKPSPV